MGTQTDGIYALVLWLEVLVALAVLGVWLWRRWGPVRTWIIVFPVGVLVVYYVFGQAVHLLPNLL
jgi:hypothetical protein